jgi:hypothetical protein
MRRFCQRCRTWRHVRWGDPGSPLHCPGCTRELADHVPTPAHHARQQRARLRRQQRRAALEATVRAFMQRRGCHSCGEADPRCLDCYPTDPSKTSQALGRLIRSLAAHAVPKVLEQCLVSCANCHRKLTRGDGDDLEQVVGSRLPEAPPQAPGRREQLTTLERRRRSLIAALVKIDAEVAELRGRAARSSVEDEVP